MTTMVPELPTTRAGRLRGMLVDTGTVAWRDLVHWRRDPARIWGSLIYSVVSVVLFGYVFGSAMSVPGGGGDYREFLMPGMFAMTMMFGIGETATAVATDAAKGVTDRFRSMPMSQVGVVAGRSLADMVNAALGIVLLVANTFVAPELMPGWLGVIADWNPLSATVTATRELFGNPGLGGGSWVAEHALPMALAWPAVLVAVFLPLSVRQYRRLSR